MSTYNGEKYLSDQINSIIRQTYSNWILVIHDDGSTDKTLDIISTFINNDSRIRLTSTNHLGVKAAFLELCFEFEAQYYLFSDQDDIWRPDKIQKLLSSAAKYSTEIPLLLHSGYDTIDSFGTRFVNDKSDGMKKMTSRFEDLIMGNNVTGCTCMFNLKLRNIMLKKQNELDYSKMLMHDWWLAIVAACFGKVVYLSDNLVSYRQHENNVLGAPGRNTPSHFRHFIDVITLKNDLYFHKRIQQATMFGTLYGSDLLKQRNNFLVGFSDLLIHWRPIRQAIFLKKYQLTLPSRLNTIQLYFFLLLPLSLRKKS